MRGEDRMKGCGVTRRYLIIIGVMIGLVGAFKR
jgi:hypothetical protein